MAFASPISSAARRVLLVAALAVATPAGAQNELPGERIDLPTVRDYRFELPPADDRPSGPEAEGPSDGPGTTPAPAPASRPTPPAERRPAPATRADPPRAPARSSPSAQPPTPRAEPPRSRAAPAPAPGTPPVPQPRSTEPEALAEPDSVETDTAETDALPMPAQPEPDAATDAPTGGNTVWWIAALLAVLAVGGLLFWRRRAARKEKATEPAERRPAPEVAAPVPAKPAPEPRVPVAQPQPAAAPAQPDAPVELAFTARGVSATVMNAVLRYELSVSNRSDTALQNVRVTGAMAQSAAGRQPGEGADLVPLHEIAVLEPGETHVQRGELKLPLAEIEPIRVGPRALFVPVACFGVQHAGSGEPHRTTFILGREQTPGAVRLAPFRLDQGPRSFAPVGWRRLEV